MLEIIVMLVFTSVLMGGIALDVSIVYALAAGSLSDFSMREQGKESLLVSIGAEDGVIY